MSVRKGKIYLIRNTVNGKGYVGQTTRSVAYRFNQHKYETKTGCDRAIHRAMKKWGFENFKVEQVASCEPLLLDDLEKHFIKFYNTYAPVGHGYNLTQGGGNGFDSNEGRVLSMEGRAKLSQVHKGNAYAKGHKVSDEGRARMSAANRNRGPVVRSEALKARISATLKGHSVSEETRAKLSEAHKGKKYRHLSANRKPMSDEHKAKIAEGVRRFHRNDSEGEQSLVTRG